MHWFRSHGFAIAPALSSLATMAMTPVLMQMLVPEGSVMLISLCSSDGVEQTIAVPLGDDEPGPMDQCQTACHAMCSRKDQVKPGYKPKV
ncbi:hypothetical protein [Alterisphingorhabdus coralli]|uniref:Uncharacterized protein n=1 Tax=Alterisphingorhabdus coralli TaxID=3071408 RepID=A0AA97I1I4_9SPHN|nr:hypothetical protein [Parasphingorhabdus sp. SCSIO 66989]WOE75330.1 hypothetical protein RB602_01040 [Parasphingorhabdus sp. SCSIO 66989]